MSWLGKFYREQPGEGPENSAWEGIPGQLEKEHIPAKDPGVALDKASFIASTVLARANRRKVAIMNS